ncbi:RNA 2'-phosphotransferase [Limibacter armeniacum]|uniref:RNA 2'-phosphotransferase n=1 Tax=Limibacter armeniacum TaxID=466084 RepID=UPI002FE6404E
MEKEKELKKISKFLSLVLRHKPEVIGVELDNNGWTSVELLIQKMNASGHPIDLEILNEVVQTNNKKRFAFNESQALIRANQGHSVQVELGYTPQQPPEKLYHGTAQTNVDSIIKSGIERRDRHHVHLSPDTETATNVGQRHGKPVVLTVLSGQMYQERFAFYLSENGVWLTDHVPAQYLQK